MNSQECKSFEIDAVTINKSMTEYDLKGKFNSGIEGALASTLNHDFNWKQLSEWFFLYLSVDAVKVYLSNIEPAKICIKVECDVNYKTVLLDYSLLLSFILYELIMLIYAKNLIFTINH